MKPDQPGKDYTSRAFTLTLGVIVVLLAVAYIPATHIGKVRLKRANIVADLMEAEESPAPMGDAYFDTTFLAETPIPPEPDTLPPDPGTSATATWDLPGATPADTPTVLTPLPPMPADPARPTTPADTARMVAIEDFSADGEALAPLFDALADTRLGRPVRIGVLGDSFIEGDIITADLREKLQNLFGGNGVGFVPLANGVAKYRETVRQTFSDWETYSLIHYKNTPEQLQDKFFISGTLCIPGEGATSHIKGSSFRKHIARCSTARLLFINEGHTSIRLTVNDTIDRVFRPEPAPYVQQIAVSGDIGSVAMTFTDTEGFTGYGVMLEGHDGVTVDNYSLRSNSGLPLLASSGRVNSQINRLAPYDLIILQYGLNVISADVLNYNAYSRSLCRIVDYIRQCFPDAAILVMSVGDRSTQRDGELVTMAAVPAMIRAQRAAADTCGVAFWDTFRAMGGAGSMVRFVERNWAAKDYTHIGYPAGRFIAGELVRALLADKQAYEAKRRAAADSAARLRAVPDIVPAIFDSAAGHYPPTETGAAGTQATSTESDLRP